MSMRRIIFARAPLGKTTPRCVVNSVTRTAFTTRVVARTFSQASFNPRLHSPINAPKKFSLHQQRTYASAPEGMYKLVMPALSPTMTQGNLAKWRKKVGDKIKPGDVLAEIETDKATLDFEATDEGYLARILVPAESQNVPVGKVIAITVEEEADIAKITDELVNSIVGASSTASAAPTQATAQKPQPQQQPQQQQSQSHQATGVSPAARFLIDTENLDPSSIKPTGKGGRLTKSDVILALENNTVRRLPAAEKPQATATAAAATTTTTTATAAPRSEKPTAVYQDIQTTQMRKVIAQRLTESKQRVPHFYVSFEARIDHIMKLRASILETLGAKVSLNDFIILAVARALNECPECNVIFDQAKNEVVQSNTVDISIAVATDKGLITPIVKQADKMTVIDISTAVKNLAARAREGKLKPEEFQGGSFSISNLGMFGISDFSAVINPPQAIILAVGGSEKRAIVNGATSAFTSEEDYDDAISRPVTIEYTNDGVPTNIGMGTFISGSLSCDRRAVDEAQVSKFLAALQKHIRAMGLI